jgi:hypothetical protein
MNYSAKNLIKVLEQKAFTLNVPMAAIICISMLQVAKLL